MASRVPTALLVLGLLTAACERPALEVEALGPPSGPVVARVAGEELRLDELEPLARLALELRASQGLPAGELAGLDLEARVALAAELVALAAEARARLAAGGEPPPALAEARERLLARVLLGRLVARVDARPVTEEDLAARHAEEVRRFQAQGGSALFEPTRVDAVVVSAAPFPDLAEHPGHPAPCTRGQVAALLEDLRREVGEREPDLDAFLSRAWARARGQPCLRVESVWDAPLAPGLSPLAPVVAQALAGLDGAGAVSRPVWSGDAGFLVRRGASRPGRGESVEAARADLEAAIRLDRRREAADGLRAELRRRYEVQAWPARLPAGS